MRPSLLFQEFPLHLRHIQGRNTLSLKKSRFSSLVVLSALGYSSLSKQLRQEGDEDRKQSSVGSFRLLTHTKILLMQFVMVSFRTKAFASKLIGLSLSLSLSVRLSFLFCFLLSSSSLFSTLFLLQKSVSLRNCWSFRLFFISHSHKEWQHERLRASCFFLSLKLLSHLLYDLVASAPHFFVLFWAAL
jgi:hypothetical protein